MGIKIVQTTIALLAYCIQASYLKECATAIDDKQGSEHRKVEQVTEHDNNLNNAEGGYTTLGDSILTPLIRHSNDSTSNATNTQRVQKEQRMASSEKKYEAKEAETTVVQESMTRLQQQMQLQQEQQQLQQQQHRAEISALEASIAKLLQLPQNQPAAKEPMRDAESESS